MGAVLEPTTAAAPWIVEVRNESFCLSAFHPAGDDAPHRHAGEGHPRPGDRVLDVPLAEAGRIAAALDQVAAHPAYGRYVAAHGAAAVDAGLFRLSLAADRLAIVGPWTLLRTEAIAGGDGAGQEVATGGEIGYRHLAGLVAEFARLP